MPRKTHTLVPHRVFGDRGVSGEMGKGRLGGILFGREPFGGVIETRLEWRSY